MKARHIAPFLGFILFLPQAFGTMTEAQVRSSLQSAFAACAGDDDIDLDQQTNRANMAFSERFPGLLEASGWTQQDVMSCVAGMLNEALTNGPDVVTNNATRFLYEQAMTDLARYGGTNALPVLAYGARHPGAFRWPNGFLAAYVAIAGGGPSARAGYSNFVSGPNPLDEGGQTALFGAMRNVRSAPRLTEPDRQGIDGFVLLRSYNCSTATPAIDRYLCTAITNYVRSNLRKDAVNRYVTLQSHVTYFLPIQAQLNAATNLVELSTNDFLNAGE